MTSPAARIEIIIMVEEAVAAGARQGRACAIVGLSLRTLQRWKLSDTKPDGRTTRVQEPSHALTIEEREHILSVVNSVEFGQLPPSQIVPRLAELGTSCPDHFLRTKIKPLYVDWDGRTEDVAALQTKLAEGIAAYRKDYAAYYDRCKHANSPAMRDANPVIFLIPGVGMLSFARDKATARIARDPRHHDPSRQ